MAEFAGSEPENDLMELDPVTMETYKAKFTQSSFKEELASFFPLIHRIMQETNTIDLEDYVKEESDICPDCKEDPCVCDAHVKESAFNEFEEWAEATEQGTLTDDQIAALKQALDELPNGELELGPEGQTAWQFFSGLGLDDSDLEDKFKAAADLDPTTDPIEVLQVWAQESYPELLVALGLSGTGQEEPAPAPEVGAQPEAQPPVEQPVAEGKEGNMVQEVAKIVKSFYNRDNPEVGPFRGTEGIVLDVKKSISEKFGEEAGEQAAQMAEQFMEKLTMEWQQRHGQVGAVEPTDGLARLKELLGNVKAKVEGMGEEKNPQHSHQYDTTMKHADNPSVQQRMAAHDIKPGIAGYRDRIDMLKDLERTGKLKNSQEESGPDKSQVPAFMRKEKGGDWKMSTKDLEKEKTNSPTSSAGLARKKAELGISEEMTDIMKLAGLAK